MEHGMMANIGIIGTMLFIIIFFVLIVLIPFSVYAAQKWAHRCYTELRRTNTLLEQLVKAHGVAPTPRANQGKYEGVDIQK